MGKTLTRVLALTFAVAASGGTAGADTVLDAGDGSGLPGGIVDIPILADTTEEIRGFSLGLAHDDGVSFVLEEILIGAGLAGANESDGPDYFQSAIDPVGGPGGYVACVVDFELVDTLPPGTSEIAVFRYRVSGDAETGHAVDLTFSDDLGDPPVLTTVVPDVAFVIPETDGGMVTVAVPAAIGLACEVTDSCTCQASMTWLNAGIYSGIRVLENGEIVEELPADAESFSFELAEYGVSMLSVVPLGVIGGEAQASLCTVDCPEVPPPNSPEDFACMADDSDACTALVSWTNPQEYAGLELLLDGAVVASPAGDATEAVIVIGDLNEHTISIAGVDFCEQAFEPVSCEFSCVVEVHFRRGDCDDNGTVSSLGDAVFLLRYGFLEGAAPRCLDAADVNDNGAVAALSDAVALLRYGFLEGPPPSDPGPENCGPDPTADGVDCLDTTMCP